MKGLLIAGAGGHGKVVAETAQAMGQWNNIAFLDDRHPDIESVLSWPVLGKLDQVPDFAGTYQDIAVAIGDNHKRAKLVQRFADLGFSLPAVIHPSAYVSPSAVIGQGCAVFAQAAINAEAQIGAACIINTGATVDHDCKLAEGVHACPGAHLAGEASVGAYAWIGIGASVIQKVNIGENTVVGAGAAVVGDVLDRVTVAGVPAKVISRHA